MQEGRLTTATVLICDLVGSSAQRSALGDDAADGLAVWLDGTLRATLTRHHGSVVKSTGDGLMAVFDAATDALHAAVEMQRAMELRNRQVPGLQQLVLRIGMSAGDVHFVAHDCHGLPVVEAARLEQACEPSAIFAGSLVRLLAGSRGGHEFERVGLLDLKGLPGPLEAYRVLWTPAATTSQSLAEPAAVGDHPQMPLPRRLAQPPPIGVIGYTDERQLLAEAAPRTHDGRGPEIVLVSGEAGVGKTTITAEAARLAHAQGACVLFGHCEEDLATPYHMFAEALGYYVAHATDDDLVEYAARYGSELLSLVPALATRVPTLPASKATDSETQRFLLFEAAVGLLAAESERRPVVLVLDDLQWADQGSLALLGFLISSDAAARVLVIGAFRDSELAQAIPLRESLAALGRHSPGSRLELRGLDNAGVVEFMEALAGYELGTDEMSLADAVYRETDGNPFYVNQVLRHLVDTSAIVQDMSGRWVARGSFEHIDLPSGVREVIGGRVVALGERAERVLNVAAVIGRDFDLRLLGAAAEIDDDDLIDMLDAAVSSGLVRETADEPGRYYFTHALIQHTLYENLGPTRRARTHRRVAEALERLCAGRPGPRIGELARHWISAADPMTTAKAIEYSRLAGDAALEALAPSDALQHYTTALDLYQDAGSDDVVLAIDLAIGLGTAQRQVGEPAFRDTLLGAARRAIELDDTDRLVAAALATHRGLFSSFGAIDAERVAVFEEALARVGSEDPKRALILATYCLEIVVGSSLERRQALADEALAIAKAVGDDAVIVRVLNNVAYALMAPPMLEQSLVRTAEGLQRAERLGDPVLLFFAANWRRQACAQAGDSQEMDRCTEVMRGLAERLNQPVLTWVHVFSLAWLAIIKGELGVAEQIATEALAIGSESGQPDAEFIFGGQSLIVEQHRGRLDALTPLVEEMAATTPTVAGVLRGALAVASAEAGRFDEVRRRLEEFAEAGFDLEMNPVWITGMAFYAEAAIELDDPEFAEPLFQRLAPWSSQWSDNGATAASPVSHYLGGLAAVLGRHDEADAYFVTSAEMCDRMSARYFGAQTDLLWGRMLARRGSEDHERARELLERARETAAAHGYGNVERRAADALARLLTPPDRQGTSANRS